MTKTEQQKLIRELIKRVKDDIIYESSTYPADCDGIELRWRIADVFSQVVFGEVGKRKGKRYQEYKNTVIVKNLR